jgi:SAM-dependent methyltransferase
MTSGGWTDSADAWIASQGERGDWSREFVLDAVMLSRVGARTCNRALDLGCGEGRFCRVLKALGIAAVGADPTEALLARARALDPDGDYHLAGAEMLPFPDRRFDLVVSYLSLIDIPDFRAGLRESARVLAPGGSLLIANLNSFTTAAGSNGWIEDEAGNAVYFPVDTYLEERADWVAWRGIRVRNWHRPFSAYVRELLSLGLELVFFDEPAPHGGPVDRAERYRRAPWFHVMEWRKPDA